MYQTVRIDWKHIMSRVRVSVRPSIFYARKTPKYYREYRVARGTVYLNDAATGHWSPAEPAKRSVDSVMVGCHRPIEQRQPERRRRWVCACARVCACVRVCVRVCVRTCVHAWVRDVFEIYDNNIWPRLIMIIIKFIILYFIQITHTGEFPSTGTRLVINNA